MPTPLILQHHDDGLLTLQSPLLRSRGITHAFSTRLGGVSKPPYDSLNLDTLTKDDATDPNTHVAENFRRIRRALNLTRHVRLQARQVHGAAVWRTGATPLPLRDTPQADAIITDDPAAFALVRTADCVPILLTSDDGSVVAAVHAGWRGIVANVIARTVEQMLEHHRLEPRSVVAAIGPSIGPDHFEVGPEVAVEFERAGLAHTIRRPCPDHPAAKPHIDLKLAAASQLQSAGLTSDRIDLSDHCTHAHSDLFFSHRRDKGKTGRMAAVIAPKTRT